MRILTFILLFFISIQSFAQVTIFSENMGIPVQSGTPLSWPLVSNYTGWQNNGSLIFTGTADVRNNLPSSYVGSSGGGNVFITNTSALPYKNFKISNINTLYFTNIQLSLGFYKSTTATNGSDLSIEISEDDNMYTPLSFSVPTSAIWRQITPSGIIPSALNLRINFRQTNTLTQFRVDDVKLIGTPTLFRSRQSGNWSDFNTWEYYNGSSWLPSPSDFPNLSISNVIIQNGHTVTTTTSTICKDLTINGSLSLGSNLSVNGNWSKSSIGNIITNDNIIYFTGSSNSTISGEQTFDKLHLTKTSSTLSLSDNISINKELLVTSGTLDLANKDITILSKQSHTAYVGKVTGNISYSGTGRFIVERYIATGLGSGQHLRSWQLLSTPTSGTQTIKSAWQEGSLTPNSNPNPGYGTQITNNNQNWQADGFDAFSPGNPSMRYYNSTTNSWVSVLSTNEPIYNPNGYMVFVRGDRSVTGFGTPVPTILRTRGKIFEPNNLPPVINVGLGEFQSVGNPYPSSINFHNTIKTGGVQDVYYVWDPRLGGAYNLGGYQTFIGNNSGGYKVIPGGGSYRNDTTIYLPSQIESGSAFFIKSDSISGGTLTFNENSKVQGSNLVNRTSNISQITSKISVIYNNQPVLLSGSVSEFSNRYSNNIDFFDYRSISNGEGVTILRDGIRLVTERRSNIEFTDTIFYSFNFRVRKYKLDFTSFNMNGIKKIILNDRYLNTKHDINLRDTTSHIFDVTSDPNSSRSDRFYLVLYKKIGRELFNTKIVVSPNPSTNFINISTNLVDGRYEYIISDVLGNPKKSSILMIIGGRATINTGLNEGVYQLTIRDKTQSISTNFISK